MTLTEFMDERYKNREDKGNMFGVGVSDKEFSVFIIDYLLGEDWYVVDTIGQAQINEIALYKILEKYSKRYRKECKGRKWEIDMEKETYVVSDLDNYWQKAIRLTEEQAKAIEWFIDKTDIDYYIQKASEVKDEVE